jgi:large subunit ribosomal protein L31
MTTLTGLIPWPFWQKKFRILDIANSNKIRIFAPLFLKPNREMKKDIHPKDYRLVVFKDMSNEYAFMSKSTVKTKETIVWEDGKEYPLVKLEISHTSHPFYTGKMKLVDTAGRVDKFKSRYKSHIEKKSSQ